MLRGQADSSPVGFHGLDLALLLHMLQLLYSCIQLLLQVLGGAMLPLQLLLQLLLMTTGGGYLLCSASSMSEPAHL